ncbi:MAG: endolytic transglycosylase MltG [Bacteroidales bacterium]|jgi:UPF0755 protein|nr:endolytic transglycosylase MltG [Bacteroidales bacterium]
MKKRIIISVILFIVLLLLTAALKIWFAEVKVTERTYIYIEPQTTYTELGKQLQEKGILKNKTLFNLCAKAFGYDKVLKTGRYCAEPNMQILTLVSRLKHGRQSPVRLVIGKSRIAEDFAEKMSQNLMFSAQDLLTELQKEGKTDSLFFFIVPNTYEIYWNVSPKDFISRMERESVKFWQSKMQQLRTIGLSREQVIIIASIVEEETNEQSEKARIAGVYINRLNKGMPLQADPTIKYALKNFELKRITGEHLKVSSPYNTYRTQGLPPSPICIPSMSSLNAVLNYEKHNFLFFCAREDFSGFHNFASNAKEHFANSRKYHQELNKRNIN